MVEKKTSETTEPVKERASKEKTYLCEVKCTWKGEYFKVGQKVTTTEEPPKEYFTKVE